MRYLLYRFSFHKNLSFFRLHFGVVLIDQRVLPEVVVRVQLAHEVSQRTFAVVTVGVTSRDEVPEGLVASCHGALWVQSEPIPVDPAQSSCTFDVDEDLVLLVLMNDAVQRYYAFGLIGAQLTSHPDTVLFGSAHVNWLAWHVVQSAVVLVGLR